MKKQRKQLLPSEELNDDDESVSPTAVTVTESNNEKEDNNKVSVYIIQLAIDNSNTRTLINSYEHSNPC